MSSPSATQSYDVICAGSGLSHFLCGALLSKAGQRVLVIDEQSQATPRLRDGFFFDPDFQPLTGCRPDYVLGRCLTELGISVDKLERPPVLTQVLAPKYRVSFWENPETTAHELARETTTRNMVDFFSLLYQAGESVSPFIEKALSFGASSDSEQKKWKKFWGPYYPSVASRTPHWISSGMVRVFSEETASAAETIAAAILGGTSFASPQNLGFEQVVRSLALYFQGGHFYPGGIPGLKQRLGEFIKGVGGEVQNFSSVESLVVDSSGKRVTGVLLSSFEGLCRSDIVVLSSGHHRLYRTLPEAVQDTAVLRELRRIVPSHWRFTISILVRKDVIPVGATPSMVYVGSEKYLLEGENYLRIHTTPALGSSQEELVNLLVTALVPYRDSTTDYSYLRRLGGKMLQALSEVMPFLEKNIVAIAPDFRKGEHELRDYYPVSAAHTVPENLWQYYVRGHRMVQDFWGPSWSTPHPNIYFTGRIHWPSLGVYGEALSARYVCDDILARVST